MKLIALPLVLSIFFVRCTKPSPVIEASPKAKAINAFFKDYVEKQKIPGLTLAATENDTIVYAGAFGFRNINTREPLKTSHMFHWASVSKTFVATAILQLVEQGKIKLDDKVIAYVPYFKQKGEDYKDITIRQMLNHTSGVGDVEDYEWDKPQNDAGAPERFVRGLENDSLLFKPGQDWSYSNTAFEVLGVLISNVSKLPFETYVAQNILKPLGMTGSSFVYPDIPDSLRVTGHEWAGKPVASPVYPYNKIHAPSSTLNSNVSEMTRYAMANLHRGKYNNSQILSDSSYDILWSNAVQLKDKPAVGASWFLGEHKGMKTVSHGGSDTGFTSFLLLVPEKNISVMVACNYELCRSSDIAYAVLNLLMGETPTTIKRQIGFTFAEILIEDGVEKAKAFYKTANQDSILRKDYLWDEDDAAMTYPGYLLLDHKMFKEAIQLFNFNVALNPDSGHAYGHLGVAYAQSSNKELARINLMKATELVPSEEYFKRELRKLDSTKLVK